MLKQFLSPPNWFTAASIFCGFYAVLLAGGADAGATQFYQAGLLIGFAGVFDVLDGRVARMTNSSSEFGVQLDSLADALSFGLAPAVLVYRWGLDSLGILGLGASFFFMICGIFRLARFNTGAADNEEWDRSRGLTITMGGGSLAALVMFHAATGKSFVANPWGPFAIVLVVAFLMVSAVPYRTAKSLKMNTATKVFFALLFGGLIVVGIFFDISFMVLPVMASYVLSGPIEGAIIAGRSARARARAKRQ